MKPLDEMVKSYNSRNQYHCLDCEVEVMPKSYAHNVVNMAGTRQIEPKIIRKLLAWCFG